MKDLCNLNDIIENDSATIITTKEIMTPDHLFTCLRCSGWEYVSEEEKVLKDK